MKFSAETEDVRGIGTAFVRAADEVTALRSKLLGQATGPESADVIGSDTAAAQYTQAYQTWGRSLEQLIASLETMSRKLSSVAGYYEATEEGNTVRDN